MCYCLNVVSSDCLVSQNKYSSWLCVCHGSGLSHPLFQAVLLHQELPSLQGNLDFLENRFHQVRHHCYVHLKRDNQFNRLKF